MVRFSPFPERPRGLPPAENGLMARLPSLRDEEALIVNDLQILASSVRNLSGLILQAEEGLKGERDEESKEGADDDDDKEEEDGKEEMVEEQPAVRPLGGFEKFFGTCGMLGLGLIYFVADVSGPVCTDMLARAMRMCVKRHPNLRSHLVPGGLKTYPFSKCPPILVPLIETEDVLAWTEEQLNHSVRVKQGTELYPWSLYLHYTPSTSQHQIVLFMHHAISDGDSINHLLQSLALQMDKQLLQRLASRSRLIQEVSALPLTRSADVQLLNNFQGSHCVSTVRTLWANTKRTIFQRGRVPDPVERLTFQERSTCISSFTMEPAVLKRVLATCKAEGTTMTGALAAAAAQEMEGFINRADTEKEEKRRSRSWQRAFSMDRSNHGSSSNSNSNSSSLPYNNSNGDMLTLTPATSSSSSTAPATTPRPSSGMASLIPSFAPRFFSSSSRGSRNESESKSKHDPASSSISTSTTTTTATAAEGSGNGKKSEKEKEKKKDRGKEYIVRVDVLVNFRGKVAGDAKTQESHQLFAAPVDILLKAGRNGDKGKLKFWDAARQVRSDVVAFLEQPHQVIDTLGMMNTLGRFGVRGLKKHANGPRQGRSRAISISNLGVTDKVFLPTDHGFGIGKTQWGIDEGFIGHSIFLAMASYQGALHFTLSYAPSIFTREMAQEFGEGVIQRCLEACPPLEG